MIFTVGIALSDNDATKFISYVSSDYPNAAGWNSPGAPIAAAPKYTNYVSDAEAMKEIFSDIASEATSVSASAKLTQTAVLADTISQYFKLPEGATKDSIKVYTSAAKFEDGAFTWGTEEELTNASVKIDGQKIEVTGFDYTANCVTKTAKNKEGTDFGKKLVIYIPIEKDATKAQFGGYLPTNTDATLGDTYGDTGFTAQSAHKDCTVVAPKLAGKTITIKVGETATTTELFKNIMPDGTEWPDGSNNAGVKLVYTIKDKQGNTIATATVPAGSSEVTWKFESGKADENLYDKTGDFAFTLDCTVTCKNETAHEGSTANSTRATGIIKVEPTTATVTLTKEIAGSLTDAEKQSVMTNLKVYAKLNENNKTELVKGSDGKYSATLQAGNYTIEETNYTVDGYTCTSKLNNSDTFTLTVVAGQDKELTLTNTYEKLRYTVTYTDGVENATVFEDDVHNNVAYGSTIPGFTGGTPTRADYTFNDWTWYNAADLATALTSAPTTMPAHNLVAVAQWNAKGNVTIRYVAKDGGTVTPPSETLNPDTGEATGSTAKANDGYRFVGWYSDETCTTAVPAAWVDSDNKLTPGKPEGGWADATYYAKFVPSTVTFDLNTLITKTFEKDPTRESKDIPTGTYIFTAQIFEADDTWQQVGEIPVYTGTATLNGAASGAAFDFGSSSNPTLASGTHRYLVKEEHGGETIDGITYDSTVYRLTITVSEDGTQPNVQIEAEPQASVLSVQSVEFTSKIIFTNTYFEEKDPNALYLDFSKYVQKELTATGSKTASDVKFRVIVNGMESPIMMYNAGEEEVSTYVEFNPRYRTVLDVNFASITGGNTETKDFTGSYVEIDQVGIYYFELNEEDGKRTGVTYDDSTYKVYVYVKREGDKLVVDSFDIYKDGWSVAGETITFHNTIDTGKDDYYPIIIPTIIGKDTGMLNKTDHFAYVIGYPDGTVHPNGQITRAEVATIFFRLLRDEVRDGAFTTSNSYSDVAYGKWYNNPISTMSALGIITGYPDGTFKPNKPITRAEFAAIAARFDETQSGKSATFSDVIGHWAAKEIGIAYYNEWIKGYPDGTFKPDQNITRAEAMTMINRVLERKPESPADLLTNMNKWTDNMDTSKWYYLDVQEATNSHAYTRKTFNYELWRQMLPDPDWSRYER